MDRLKSIIKHPLFLPLVFIVITHVPTWFEPLWYWDSGFYQTIAQAMDNGRKLYVDIWDNKQPGIYLLFYSFYVLFGKPYGLLVGQGFLHGFLTIWICFTAFFVYKSAINLFSKKIAIVSVWIFAFLVMPPVCTGGIPNGEILMILPTTAAFYIFSKNLHKTNQIPVPTSLIIGLLVGVGFFLKMNAIFELAAILFIILTFSLHKKTAIPTKTIALIFLGFILPWSLTATYYYFTGNISEYVYATITHLFEYILSGNSASGGSIVTLLTSKLVIRLFLMITALLAFTSQLIRSLIKKEYFAVLVLFAFELYGALFSGRDWNHYFVQIFPSLSILLALFFKYLHSLSNLKGTLPKIAHKLWIAIIVFASISFAASMTTYNPVEYYPNFILYATKQRSFEDYSRTINWEMPRRDHVVEYLNKNLSQDDTFFTYSNNAWLYSMTNKYPEGKYVVMYHMTAIPSAQDETLESLERSPPKYIVIYDYTEKFDSFFDFLDENYVLEKQFQDAYIFRIQKDT